jgi:hypothetical protein
MGVGGFGYKIRGPAGVFTAELSALFTAQRHIGEVIRPPERCLIQSLIKAMLSRKIAHQTHPLVYECEQLCWSLCQNGIEVKLMWIPSHVKLMGNDLVDARARQVALEGTIFDRPLSSSGDSVDTGRFAHSIFSDVTLRPWFDDLNGVVVSNADC